MNLIDRVKAYRDEGFDIQRALETEGKLLVAKMNCIYSLREIGRRSGLSATYLSLVLNGKATISPGAFLRLCDIVGAEG